MAQSSHPNYSTLERDEDEENVYLYKHGNAWKIGQNYSSARALLFTDEPNFENISSSDWFEILRDTKKSKKVHTVNISIKAHDFKSNISK